MHRRAQIVVTDLVERDAVKHLERGDVALVARRRI
jgi:hypothetical protein